MMRRRRAVFGLLLLLVAATQQAAIADTADAVRIATDATFPPFHFVDEDGTVSGFDVELARAIARQAGLEAEVLVLPYAALFTGLVDGRHDVVAATTGITPERAYQFLFSDAYYETCQVAVVRSGGDEPQQVVDLQDRIIAASGSGTSASAMSATPAAGHRRIDDGSGPALLRAREIDAWIVDEFDGVAAARASNGVFRVLPRSLAPEVYGFVLAQGSDTLKARWDAGLAELVANGEVERLRRRFELDRDAEWPVRCAQDRR